MWPVQLLFMHRPDTLASVEPPLWPDGGSAHETSPQHPTARVDCTRWPDKHADKTLKFFFSFFLDSCDYNLLKNNLSSETTVSKYHESFPYTSSKKCDFHSETIISQNKDIPNSRSLSFSSYLLHFLFYFSFSPRLIRVCIFLSFIACIYQSGLE